MAAPGSAQFCQAPQTALHTLCLYPVPQVPHPSWAEAWGLAPHERREAEALGVGGLVTWYRVQSSALQALTYRALPPGPQQPLGPARHPTGPLTVARDAAVLLALLLGVELVAVALAAPILKSDALPLHGIECPELDEGSAGAGDYGEVAGR